MDEKQQRNLILKSLCLTEGCAEYIVKYFNGLDREKRLNETENVVKQLSLLDMRIMSRADIVEKMRTERVQKQAPLEEGGEAPVQSVEETKDQLTGILDEKISDALAKANVEQHQIFLKYTNKVKSIIKKVDKSTAENNDDEELVFTEEAGTYIDPITKTQIVDPVKSQVCHHQFSRETIMQQINAHFKNYPKCPYVGCNKRIGAKDLTDDFELAQVLDQLKHQNQQ